VLPNKDRFCDKDRVRTGQVDRLGNSHRCILGRGGNESIGKIKGSVRQTTGNPPTRSTMTECTKWAIAERVESLTRTALILISGPGWEAMILSGALDPIANSLTAATLRLGEMCALILSLRLNAPSSPAGKITHRSVRNVRLTLAPSASSRLSFKGPITVPFSQSQNNSKAGC
jgi:hypothetical protein